MSTVLAPLSELVADLARRDIRIWREGERLRCRGTLRRPIFENRAGTLAARMSHFHVRTGHALAGVPLTPEAEAAMEALEATMNAPGMGHELWFEPGQIQVLDNRRIGHKRIAFRDYSSPERKRRLVRLWLRDAGLPTYDG